MLGNSPACERGGISGPGRASIRAVTARCSHASQNIAELLGKVEILFQFVDDWTGHGGNWADAARVDDRFSR